MKLLSLLNVFLLFVEKENNKPNNFSADFPITFWIFSYFYVAEVLLQHLTNLIWL